MINNKQVNIWRGDSQPPTIYHVWIHNTEMLLYNGIEWIVFINNESIINQINSLLERVDIIEDDILSLKKNKINEIPITNNTIIKGTDINLNASGTYINVDSTLTESLLRLDALLTTQIIE